MRHSVVSARNSVGKIPGKRNRKTKLLQTVNTAAAKAIRLYAAVVALTAECQAFQIVIQAVCKDGEPAARFVLSAVNLVGLLQCDAEG